jgi:hypothetical protein
MSELSYDVVGFVPIEREINIVDKIDEQILK